MAYRAPRSSVWWGLVAFLLAFCLPPLSIARDAATVMRVSDGDTLIVTLNEEQEKVRLIGVDTPEVHESDKLRRDATNTGQDVATIQALGQRALDFTTSLIPPGTQIQLEYGQQLRDESNRLLALVWLPDGRMLNETLICEGYAYRLIDYPFRQAYMNRFRICLWLASSQGKGLWGEGLPRIIPSLVQGAA